MSHSTQERLIYMANQIGKYFSTQKHIDPAKAIADHLAKYWDPRMRARIVAHLRAGGEGLDPEVARAVGLLARGLEVWPHQPAGANEA
ncbi:formate dehydrogenase subunit delta [Methylocella sp.]|uniref:formate dehydrogenase subunit delta n=1 Tax=Methylocella sp. TaxID=1978226 RepID=UPI0035B4B3BC